MQVTETLNEGLKRGYRITVPAADLDAKVTEKLAEAQPDVQMKGFRKGKVPLALLRKQFGPKLLGEAMQEAVDGAMSSHFEATGDRPAGQPSVKMSNENWKEGDDIEVEMTYEALPEIPEVELRTLKVERLHVTPDDAAIDDALGKLADSARTFSEKKGKAKSGDQVVIDFIGKIDGTPFDGGAAEDFPLVLGSGSFIPGFEDQMEGVKAGDEKVVEVTFPDDYRIEKLAGKAATFDVKVKEVKKPEAAKLDDDLAKNFGAEDLAALKSRVSEQLTAEYTGAARQVLKRRLLDQLDERVNFDLPPTLVDQEAHQIAHQLWHEENPDHQGHDHGEVEVSDEHRKLAERRVRLGLLLAEIGRKAEVKVTDAEMTQAVMTQARQYRGQERQFLEFVQKNAAMRQQIQAPIFEEKVIDYIVELAEVNDRDVSRDELEKEVEALDEI